MRSECSLVVAGVEEVKLQHKWESRSGFFLTRDALVLLAAWSPL